MSRGRTPITACTRSEWSSIIQRVHACIPPPEGYTWRFVWTTRLPPDWLGDCSRIPAKTEGSRGTILVRILRGLSASETELIVIHEVAHAFDMWTHHGWGDDHGDTFFLWMGRIYRRYYSQ